MLVYARNVKQPSSVPNVLNPPPIQNSMSPSCINEIIACGTLSHTLSSMMKEVHGFQQSPRGGECHDCRNTLGQLNSV